ncbi:Mitotic spindle checkpoint component mad2 [Neolecta irregularis DAH-3]|uniref:Mitotic spindle checkpoint component mad2 n=1 Tax=Neolecta irregularis (strain DAH-3) TaxID=1198029 RepID=A0A1U7LR64_NEOID|nr:Mitotic spindle checkpoint component mad2 [Neolecta irregularis DAH-3]|eukprot:OLL25134.1 Mitotic spindle checkpoint component mad2 [Neolecta irregularis DAH-3]
MAVPAPTRSKLTLKGSDKIVSEFFEYSINSILFQRAIYPPEDFKVVKKYGLNMLVTADEDVRKYIKRIMSQLNKWICDSKVSKLVVAVTSKDTGEVVERWQFDVELFNQGLLSPSAAGKSEISQQTEPKLAEEKSEKEIHAEIQAIIRQITASVTFLPILEGRCTFNVLVYADGDAEVPEAEWCDSDPKDVKNAEQVKLRSFTTGAHRVDTMVSYQLGDAAY